MASALPSLRGIAVFVAAGRTLSFTRAAQTLHLTPSGVSKRISELERELGATLFRRFNRHLELTAAGTRLLAVAAPALDSIERESAAIRPQRNRRTLRLSVLQSFATLWLMPQLAAFKKARPDLEVELETSADLVDLTDDRFDAAIRFGRGHWPGLVAHKLFETRVFPVTAPRRGVRRHRLCRELLDAAVLLGIAQTPDLWRQYLKGVSLGDYRPRHMQIFDNVQLMFEAAASGLGIALASLPLVQSQLASGRLVQAFTDPPVALEQSYYLVYRRDRGEQPSLRALRKALTGEVARVP